jgi:hypothetical protein
MATHRSLPVACFAAVLTLQGVAVAQNGAQTGQASAEPRARSRPAEIRFHAMDADNDGVITRSEWQGSDQSFRQNDTNVDGVLSGAEVAPERQAEARGRRRDDLVAQFTRADRNGDIRLQPREWTADFGSFDRADANEDGFVTRAEFLASERIDATDAASDTTAGPAADLRRATPAFQSGFDKGLADGRQAGKEDRNVNGGKWDLEGQRELEHADAGYADKLGRRIDYQAGYRAGFRRGYAEGFGPR